MRNAAVRRMISTGCSVATVVLIALSLWLCCHGTPAEAGDGLWNIRVNGDDRFHSNESWLRPWRYNYDDGCGRWVGGYSYELGWGTTYTQSSGSVGQVSWNISPNGNFSLGGARDYQWHAWTYIWVNTARALSISGGGDCVPRCFVNYAFDSPLGFPASCSLNRGWNRIDVTGYNQNDGYSFSLSLGLGAGDVVNSRQIDPPTNVSVANPGTGGRLVISWSNPSFSGFSRIRIYRSTASGQIGTPISTEPTTSPYTDAGLQNGTTYYYTLRSVDTSGAESPNTDQYSGTPSRDPAVVNSPDGWIVPGMNLISLPFEPVDPDPAVIFGGIDIQGRVYQWDNPAQGLEIYDTWDPEAFGMMSADQGYWLLTDRRLTVSYTGYPIELPHAISIAARGWAIIGCPSLTNRAWADVRVQRGSETISMQEARNRGWLNSVGLWWSNMQGLETLGLADDYASSNYLQPWHGYWIQTYVDGLTLHIY